jgi:hypothetical protein
MCSELILSNIETELAISGAGGILRAQGFWRGASQAVEITSVNSWACRNLVAARGGMALFNINNCRIHRREVALMACSLVLACRENNINT